MSVKIKNSIENFKKELDKKAEKAQYLLSSQILSDCNKYVRYVSGDLEQSSYISSDLKKGLLCWDTPYATRVYFTGTPDQSRNSNASLMWCQKAIDNHFDEWTNLIGEEISND